ncbi:hypothetical protein ABB26_04985 [Stenotrophomonas humi]|uniref:Phage gp6-like head-tail connector protein n=1 Tax=Stenotrophomonas humi TaxID=405444 RepID=A0A0R0CHR9_9GAMM|nr:hypothetical protein [Stenotrophomonas humi]KRG65169.1 hypothetical protein ABB26_04985 [Stenotrophomonas humi]
MAARADLNRLVLLKLGVVDANEAPEAEDYADVDLQVQAKLEELYGDGLIPFDLDADIPAKYMVAISFIVAVELIDDYAAHSRTETLMAGADRGKRALYRYAARPYSGAVVPSEYF